MGWLQVLSAAVLPTLSLTHALPALDNNVPIRIPRAASSTSTSVAIPSPTAPGIVANCNQYYDVVSGDTCAGIAAKFGTFTYQTFESWNTNIDSGCTNLVPGWYYCCGVSSTSTVKSSVTAKSSSTLKSSSAAKSTSTIKSTSTAKSSSTIKTSSSSKATSTSKSTSSTKSTSKMSSSTSAATSPTGIGCWTGANFPSISQWVSYSTMWNTLQPTMLYAGDTTNETAEISSAIQSQSALAGIDPRFTLAILMHESSGRTTTPCGDDGKSCGLMQVQGTSVPTCSAHPCSNSTIAGMIKCGVTGGCGGAGANINYCLAIYGAGAYGDAARCYNTGTVEDLDDLTVCKYGIRAYVSDIANYLLGASEDVMIQYKGSCFSNDTCSG